MAYINQEKKKELSPAIMIVCKKYGIKASLGIKHHSTLVLNIASGSIDFLTQYNERTIARLTEQDRMRNYSPITYVNVNNYHPNEWTGKAGDFLREVKPLMMIGNHDNSDIMTDYFDVGWYIDINVGKWDKPYVYIPLPEKAPEQPKTSPSLTADLEPNAPPLQATIEEHTHTKKGFQMFIVILAEKVDRDEYLRLLDKDKTLDGWYSMAWKVIPGGFAFKDRAKAEEFLTWLFGTPGPEPTKAPINCDELKDLPSCEPLQNPNIDLKLSAKLKESADKMTPFVEFKLSSNRLMNTNKRYKQAMQARTEGLQLERTQKAMYILSDMWEKGTIPEILKQFKTKQLIYEAMVSKKTMVQNGYHSFYACDGKPYSDTSEVLALWALLTV